MVDLYKTMCEELGITDVQLKGIQKLRSLDELADVHVVRFEKAKHHPLGYFSSHISIFGIIDNDDLYRDLSAVHNYFLDQGFDVSEHDVVGDGAFKNVAIGRVALTIFPSSIRGDEKPSYVLDDYWHKINSQ